MNKFETTLKEVYPLFEQNKEILAVYLFGSVARRDYSLRHSDMDLFIVLNHIRPRVRAVEKINSMLSKKAFKNGVKIHLEFQGYDVKEDDKSLIRKIMDEGRLVYSKGLVCFDKFKIGLKPFFVYKFTNPNKKNRARFSQILHGYSSFYYKQGKKVRKDYKGIIDENTIIGLGNGALMVLKEKEEYIIRLFREFGIEYNMVRMIFSF